jgi:hypothetical protein
MPRRRSGRRHAVARGSWMHPEPLRNWSIVDCYFLASKTAEKHDAIVIMSDRALAPVRHRPAQVFHPAVR